MVKRSGIGSNVLPSSMADTGKKTGFKATFQYTNYITGTRFCLSV